MKSDLREESPLEDLLRAVGVECDWIATELQRRFDDLLDQQRQLAGKLEEARADRREIQKSFEAEFARAQDLHLQLHTARLECAGAQLRIAQLEMEIERVSPERGSLH